MTASSKMLLLEFVDDRRNVLAIADVFNSWGYELRSVTSFMLFLRQSKYGRSIFSGRGH